MFGIQTVIGMSSRIDRNDMALNWNMLFDNWGMRAITSTNKKKSAYVLNASQSKTIEAAAHIEAISSEGGQ